MIEAWWQSKEPEDLLTHKPSNKRNLKNQTLACDMEESKKIEKNRKKRNPEPGGGKCSLDSWAEPTTQPHTWTNG